MLHVVAGTCLKRCEHGHALSRWDNGNASEPTAAAWRRLDAALGVADCHDRAALDLRGVVPGLACFTG